jgi:CBS domain-containing protein
MNDQPISTIMTKNVVVVDYQDTIEKVEAVLNSRGHHCVPVGDKAGSIFGVISLKDIEAFHRAKKNPKTIRAWEICTYKPVQLEPEDSVINAAKLMAEKNINHIVVTKNKTIQGILSSLDIVKQVVSQNG